MIILMIVKIKEKRRAAKALFLCRKYFFLPILCEFFSYSLCEVIQMTESEELKKLQEEMNKKKQRIERKYSRVAKKRLQRINQIIYPRKLIVDMNDAEFESLLRELQDAIGMYNQRQQELNNM